MKKKIFCFINGGNGRDWFPVIAICEDGHCLAEHISSSEWFALHDIGINSDIKHEQYKEHCPNGYELVWVEDARNSVKLDAAYAKNQELGRLANLSIPTPIDTTELDKSLDTLERLSKEFKPLQL
jgi:hypothetical protein